MNTSLYLFTEIANWLRAGAYSRALEAAERGIQYANTFAAGSTPTAEPRAEPSPSKPSGSESTNQNTP